MIKRGSKARGIKIDDSGGLDWQASRLNDKIFTVRDVAPDIYI